MSFEIQHIINMPNNLHQLKHLVTSYSASSRKKTKLNALKQQLAATEQKLRSAEEEIRKLTVSNELYGQKLNRIEKMYKQARHFAYHDKLTGLPNRSLLKDRLRQVMARSARQNKQLALLFIDLDKFKRVNDSYGHLAGDELLKQVAERLVTCVRTGDTVCRYGGDEFVVMLTDIESTAGVAEAVAKMRDRLSMPYQLESQRIKLSVSIGSTIYKADEQNYENLIQQADLAMYSVKAANRSSYSSA